MNFFVWLGDKQQEYSKQGIDVVVHIINGVIIINMSSEMRYFSQSIPHKMIENMEDPQRVFTSTMNYLKSKLDEDKKVNQNV